MDYNYIEKWLHMHGIVLEQGFVEAIRDLAADYKKNRHKTGTNLPCTGLF